MSINDDDTDRTFVLAIERILGRALDGRETKLAVSLRDEKSAEIVARELEGAVIADPDKIRPEHRDTANE